VAGWELGPRGETQGTPWYSYDPVLSGIDLLDWILLGFPVFAGDDSSSWSADRAVPQLGQYRLGIELPLLYERTGGGIQAAQNLRVSGLVQRPSLRVAPKLVGALSLDHVGQLEIGPDGRMRASQLELRMRFNGEAGGLVSSRHMVRIRCLDCDDAINSPSWIPDILGE